MIDVKEMSEQDLKHKIENIKEERERTANALKKYEEELERRKQEVPLGVPLKGMSIEMPFGAVNRSFIEWFSSEASADKFEEYFVNFVKALQDIAEGKPIDIKVLLPLLKKGWVAMDKDEHWFWYKNEPTRKITYWAADDISNIFRLNGMFNIKPAENWEDSLMECGL